MKASAHSGVVRLAAACRLGAAVLLAATAVRLAAAATLGAMDAGAPPETATRASAAASAPPAESARARGAQHAKRAKTPGKSVLVNLVVTVGTRSGVYVDHAYVGKSPYIGDVSCRVGDTVLVQLVPAKGAPRVFTQKCVEGGTIQIGD